MTTEDGAVEDGASGGGPGASTPPGGSASPGEPDAAAQPVTRLRARVAAAQTIWRRVAARPGIAHLIRAWDRFTDRLGNQFAAAITYFSFLSLVPILMVAFSIAGLILASSPSTLASLKDAVTALLPSGDLADSVGTLIDQAVGQSLTVGLIGLLIAAYSGLSWMGNIRDAVRAQWRPRWQRPEHDDGNLLMRYVWDLVALVGLLAAILVSFALTAVGTAAQNLVMGWLDISPGTWLAAALRVGPFALAIGAGTVTFAWVYTVLPHRADRAARRPLLIGALAMSVVFEVLKAALTLLVTRMSSSPSGVVFGSIIGLLLFFNLVARAFLMIAAWIATARPLLAPGPESA